jgi:hypothetical protein
MLDALQSSALTIALEHPVAYWTVVIGSCATACACPVVMGFFSDRPTASACALRRLFLIAAIAMLILAPFHVQAVSNRYHRGEVSDFGRPRHSVATVVCAIATLGLVRTWGALLKDAEKYSRE